MKNHKTKILMIIIIAIIIFSLFIASITWILHVFSYNKYLDENFERLSYSWSSIIDRRDKILYGAKTPPFLTFGGNLTCTSEDNTITIIAWPSFMCRKIVEIGLILNDETGHMVYVDHNMNYITELNPGISAEEDAIVKIIMQNRKNDIQELYNKMKERFSIND